MEVLENMKVQKNTIPKNESPLREIIIFQIQKMEMVLQNGHIWTLWLVALEAPPQYLIVMAETAVAPEQAKVAQSHLQPPVWSTITPPMSSILSKQEILQQPKQQPRQPQLPPHTLIILDPIITTIIIITIMVFPVLRPQLTIIRPFPLSFRRF